MAFSSAFSSGFATFAPVEPEVLRGVPLPPRQRLRRLSPVPLAGRGIISVIGRGTLAIERGLEAMVDIAIEAWGDMETDDEATTLWLLGLPNEVVL